MKKSTGGRNYIPKSPRPKAHERLTVPQTKKVIKLALKKWETKAEVGRKVGCTYQMISRYQKGESRLPIKALKKLGITNFTVGIHGYKVPQ